MLTHQRTSLLETGAREEARADIYIRTVFQVANLMSLNYMDVPKFRERTGRTRQDGSRFVKREKNLYNKHSNFF